MYRLILFTLILGVADGQVIDISKFARNYGTHTITREFTATRALPPLPTLGPANTIFKDPTFGNRILRVSDANTLTALSNTNYSLSSSSSAESNIWRKDSSMFYSGSPAYGGILFFNFNPHTFQATLVSTAVEHCCGGEPEFSYTDNNALYGADALTFVRYDMVAKTTATLFNFSTAVPGITGTNGDPSVSATETLAAPANGPQQDEWVDTIAYCVQTGPYCTAGQFAVLDYTRGLRGFGQSSYTPQPTGTNWQPTWKIHNARIGKEGRYVALTTQGTNSPYEVIWDLLLNTTQAIYSSALGGHKAQGYGTMVVGGPATSFHSYGPTNTLIPSLASANSFVNLLPVNPDPPQIGGVSDYQSMQNADANYPVPVFGSTNSSGGPGAPNYLGNGQIVAVQSDQVRDSVWQFASTRSSYVAYGGPLYTGAVTVSNGGAGYAIGDTGTVTGCGPGAAPYATYSVTAQSGGVVTAIIITSGGGNYNASSSGCSTAATTGSASGLVVNISSGLWNNFDFTPRGSVSQDGKYFLFTSAWEGTLGSDPLFTDPPFRTDIFLVELMPLTPQMEAQIKPGSTQALFLALAPDMQSCAATVYSDAGRTTTVASAADTVRDGRTSQIVVSGLTPATTYWTKLACGGGNGTMLASFTTRQPGSGTYRFPVLLPSSQAITYCGNAAMTSGCTTLSPATRQTIPVAANSVAYAKIGSGGSIKALIAP